jgi:hypothetical protein
MRAGNAVTGAFSGCLFFSANLTGALTISDITVTDALLHDNGNNGSTGTGHVGHGCYFRANSVTLTRVESYNNHNGGCQLVQDGSGNQSQNPIVRDSSFHNNYFGLAVQATGGVFSNIIVTNNVIYGINDGGTTRTTPNIFNHILVSANSLVGMRCGLDSVTNRSCVIRNSIFAGNGGEGDLVLHNGWTNTGSHNACISTEAQCGTSKVTIATLNTCVMDSATEDFHLHAPPNVCIDAGTNTSITADYDGGVRPQDGDGNGSVLYDIGPYEYGASGDTEAPLPPTGLTAQ